MNMNTSKSENVCARCGKVFSRKADCNRHSRLHDDIRPHLCEVAGCGKRFAQYTALKTHHNVHTGSKPFKCELCKSAFGDPSSCARHRREIHYPAKPFKCPYQGCTSSIRRSSAFKNHLKKHGLDPGKYSTRDHSPTKVRGSTEPKGIREGQVFSFHGSSSNQEIPLASLPNSWDSFFLDSPAPLAMQPELTSGIPCSQPLLLAPSPRIAPDYNGGYYLSPPRASPEASSRYSSPMAPTPALTPETVPGFTSDVSLQLSPCRATPRLDTSAWQDHGIWFVG